MTAPSEGLAGVPERPMPGEPAAAASFDPLKLCIFTTVALLAWIFGPVAVAVFAVLGLAGYWRAHRAGLTRSRCYLRDVRLVLIYLGIVLVAALAGIAWTVYGWTR
jgi:heme/copper-type cytochrome/quinol oxidase subunit 2